MTGSQIPVLVPDLPGHAALAPYLARIDEARWYTNFGPLAREFEKRMGRMLVHDHRLPPDAALVTVNSGTAALELALAAHELPVGARVLVPAFTFSATPAAICRAGLEPVFADVDEESWCLTPAIAQAATARLAVDAVVPVSAFGCPLPAADWDRFVANTGLPVIMDAAAGVVTQRVGRAFTTTFSLHATKPLGIGEGGLVASCDHALIDRIRRLSNFGLEAGWSVQAGTNAKLSEYHAAVGLAQMDRQADVRARLARVCEACNDASWSLSGSVDVQCPHDRKRWLSHIWPLLLPDGLDAEQCGQRLLGEGIGMRRWWCPSVARHSAFAHFRRWSVDGEGTLPSTDRITRRLLGLPCHAWLRRTDIDRVANALHRIVEDPGACASESARSS